MIGQTAGFRVRTPLTPDEATQHLVDNPSFHGTVLSAEGVDANGIGAFQDVTYTVAYWAGPVLKELAGVRPITPRYPDIIDIVAAAPGDPVWLIRRGQYIDFVILSFPNIEVCETQP